MNKHVKKLRGGRAHERIVESMGSMLNDLEQAARASERESCAMVLDAMFVSTLNERGKKTDLVSRAMLQGQAEALRQGAKRIRARGKK